MTEEFKKQIETEARQAVTELLAQAKLKKGDVFVVGCSSSEIVGGHIGKDSSPERGPHPAPDRDRLLRQHAQEHRGNNGGKCGTGKECARKSAPERQEKRLKTAFFTHKLHIRQKPKFLQEEMTADRDFFCCILRQKREHKPLQSGA